jgi:hypothetical protein
VHKCTKNCSFHVDSSFVSPHLAFQAVGVSLFACNLAQNFLCENLLILKKKYTGFWYRVKIKLCDNDIILSSINRLIGYVLGADVDVWRFSDGVLHDEEEFGDDLDDVARVEDKVALLLAQVALKQTACGMFSSLQWTRPASSTAAATPRVVRHTWQLATLHAPTNTHKKSSYIYYAIAVSRNLAENFNKGALMEDTKF